MKALVALGGAGGLRGDARRMEGRETHASHHIADRLSWSHADEPGGNSEAQRSSRQFSSATAPMAGLPLRRRWFASTASVPLARRTLLETMT